MGQSEFVVAFFFVLVALAVVAAAASRLRGGRGGGDGFLALVFRLTPLYLLEKVRKNVRSSFGFGNFTVVLSQLNVLWKVRSFSLYNVEPDFLLKVLKFKVLPIFPDGFPDAFSEYFDVLFSFVFVGFCL